MADADQDVEREPGAGNDQQTAATANSAPAPAPDERDCDIHCRLAALEMSVQQLRMSVDSLSGSVGSVPGTLMSVVWDIRMLANNVTYLVHQANTNSMTTGHIAASVGNLLSQSAMIYADTQALRGHWPLAQAASVDASSFASSAIEKDSSQPGETGFI